MRCDIGTKRGVKDEVREAIPPASFRFAAALVSAGSLTLVVMATVVKHLDPIFATLAPGRGNIPRTPGREKANADWIHTAVYQVITGAPVGTFVTFTLNRSLAEWDELTAKMQERNKAIDAALGGDPRARADPDDPGRAGPL